jgi:hypothetical protein
MKLEKEGASKLPRKSNVTVDWRINHAKAKDETTRELEIISTSYQQLKPGLTLYSIKDRQ